MEGLKSGKSAHGNEILRKADGKTISPHDLKPGDLIFKYTGEQLLHVSIVTSVDAERGAADHAHQLNDAALTGLHETTVTTASNLVVRCRNLALRDAAAEFALRWTRLAMPYSAHRRRAAAAHAEKSGADVVATHRKLFDEVGKFRAIKFAARRNGDLIYPGESDPRIEGNRGMFCSMFVAVCYQVAGLQGVVREAPAGMRVSDKTTANRDFVLKWLESGHRLGGGEADRLQFDSYLARLTELDPYVLHDLGSTDANAVASAATEAESKMLTGWFDFSYQPSLAFWSGNISVATFNWPQYITKGMMLDAKVIMPEGLLLCLLDDLGESGGWEMMGILGAVKSFQREKNAEMEKRLQHQQLTNKRFPPPST